MLNNKCLNLYYQNILNLLNLFHHIFLFIESAELNLEDITDVDNILLETQTDLNNFVLLDRTDSFNFRRMIKLLLKKILFAETFAKNETIMNNINATATVLKQKIKEKIQDYSYLQIMLLLQRNCNINTSNATAKVKKYRANPVENLQQLLNYSDPDHTISDFLTQMKEEFLNAIPTKTDSALDRRKLIKNIQSLYRAKY